MLLETVNCCNEGHCDDNGENGHVLNDVRLPYFGQPFGRDKTVRALVITIP